MASVPQAMAATVRTIRLRWMRAAVRKSLRMTRASAEAARKVHRRSASTGLSRRRGAPGSSRRAARSGRDTGGGAGDHRREDRGADVFLEAEQREHRAQHPRRWRTHRPADGGDGQCLEQELADDVATAAPMAIFMPISLVRSSTTTYMMLLTPIPPTTSVSAPTMPRNSRKSEEEGVEELHLLGGVPHPDRLLVDGIELVRAGQGGDDLLLGRRTWRRFSTWKTKLSTSLATVEGAEGGRRDDRLVLVAPVVVGVLGLGLHDPDHQEGHTVDRRRFGRRRRSSPKRSVFSLSPRNTTRRRRSMSSGLM